jgi:hypothetical protein
VSGAVRDAAYGGRWRSYGRLADYA